MDRPWENCMTIARKWAWKSNDEVKSLEQSLGQYGYTIYGTRGGPFKPADWGVSTRKNKIYETIDLIKIFTYEAIRTDHRYKTGTF